MCKEKVANKQLPSTSWWCSETITSPISAVSTGKMADSSSAAHVLGEASGPVRQSEENTCLPLLAFVIVNTGQQPFTLDEDDATTGMLCRTMR